MKENVIANPKSIFTVLAAGLGAGTVIKIQAEGSDEKQAVDDLCEFIASLKE
ncbi:MAG: HPr family phosphocarrier protein [Lachnospiraceae bacterium]